MIRLIIIGMLLSHGFAIGQDWNADLKKALSEASAANKNVLLYFSVPEACDRCKALEERVFQSPEFMKYAQKFVVLAKADFSGGITSEEKIENLLIVEKYNKDGFFPFVVIMDKNGKILSKSGAYNNEDAALYIGKLQNQ